MKKTINWALAGTGGITNHFFVGLRAAEGACIKAAVSRTKENADKFAAQYGIEKAFDSFDNMLEDPAIDAVYIGTPHTTHRDMVVKALKAKKAVLCEKPTAINAGELKEMIGAARDNKTFFMEAMWTRFTPPLCKVREWLSQGFIGEVKMVQANFGFSTDLNPQGRLFNLELGGGSLLDAGIYPLSLASMVFGGKKPEKISSQAYFGETGVDEEAAVILSYGGPRIAYAASAIRTAMVNDGWIYGTQGRIHLPGFVFSHKAILMLDGRYDYTYEPDFYSNGYNYEAEAVMDCIREGKTESEVMPWAESLVLMETMDEIRRQWNFKYPCER
ncbi:Gfo/Idh/MocA family protein [Leadbettera azotonutricia]|uniref:Oxidoreductase domain protein n=1 Tax=Leadbettera azotonutricia (strain ATCC BAA-888 / DSM 13862 / ZAS-9) TaxID=545695 RepID=F5Y7U4_LEAAZ|nr:Gfo/Idh/MocA family oxidoreductase [Leadbettera azotonutricia]AEF83053.1 oxidoreductase domain protein [Leadbettera azotonutricia ZAS-9]